MEDTLITNLQQTVRNLYAALGGQDRIVDNLVGSCSCQEKSPSLEGESALALSSMACGLSESVLQRLDNIIKPLGERMPQPLDSPLKAR